MDRRTAVGLLLALAGAGAMPRARASNQQHPESQTLITVVCDVAADAQHSRWSDPGAYRAYLQELPTAPNAIPDALENFVAHHSVARLLGQIVPADAEGDRHLRRTAKLLDVALSRDGRALTEPRDPEHRLFGTCHDFALLATSILRENGIPARVRVGYAGYLAAGHWEDHRVCQHWTGTRWAILDAQLGSRTRSRLGIGFEVSDMPEGAWRSSASIWRAIRDGEIDAARCGISFAGLSGHWFVGLSMLRDAAALAGIETLPWDTWGPGRGFGRTRQITQDQADDMDALAAALDPAPNTRATAETVLFRFPWARPTSTIRTHSVQGDGIEIALDDA